MKMPDQERRWEDQFPQQRRRMRKGMYLLPSPRKMSSRMPIASARNEIMFAVSRTVSPWAMIRSVFSAPQFTRATFIPASINPRIVSSVEVEGPSVQTILVRGV